MRAVLVPAVVGIPLMRPVEASRVNPAGSEPVKIVWVYEVSPPIALIKERYGTPTRAVVLELVFCKALWGVILQLLVICSPCELLAPTVKVKVPSVSGVPVIWPLPAFRLRPVGNCPLKIAKLVAEKGLVKTELLKGEPKIA